MMLRRSASRSALLALALAASFAAAPYVGAPIVSVAVAETADFIIENHTIEPDDDTTITFPRIEVKGSNLGEADFLKMMDADLEQEERAALARRFEAASLVIPTIAFETEKAEGTLTGFSVSDIRQGRVAQAAWQSIEISDTGSDVATKDARASIGPMLASNIDISTLLTLGHGPTTPGMTGKASLEIRDIRIAFPEQRKGRKTPGAMLNVSVGSIWGSGTYDDTGLPAESAGGIRNVVFEPPADSEAGKALAQFGTSKIDAGLELVGRYDAGAMKIIVPNYTISGVDMGALTLMAELGSIDKFAFTGDQRERMRALMKGDLVSAGVKFVNDGIFDKAVALMARRSGKTPEALKREWSGLAGQMLPMLLGGDSGALQLASEIQKFIAEPKNLWIGIGTKNGPIPFAEMEKLKDPAALLQRITIDAKANQ